MAGHETTVQMVWDEVFLTVRFTCRYQELHLREGPPHLERPSEGLWNHDVAEIFIAAEDAAQEAYAEFEVSPRGEWIALQIRTETAGDPKAVPLTGQMHFAASIDHNSCTWYGLIRLPFSTLTNDMPFPGMRFRMNLFRSQGHPPVELAWKPTLQPSFHVPECFGALILAEAE